MTPGRGALDSIRGPLRGGPWPRHGVTLGLLLKAPFLFSRRSVGSVSSLWASEQAVEFQVASAKYFEGERSAFGSEDSPAQAEAQSVDRRRAGGALCPQGPLPPPGPGSRHSRPESSEWLPSAVPGGEKMAPGPSSSLPPSEWVPTAVLSSGKGPEL